ncbi:MAG: hypothetical protein GY909_08275 [Oligoflexia bacterium]|nr:hypothetical protein [Oligoflexia bacterium]
MERLKSTKYYLSVLLFVIIGQLFSSCTSRPFKVVSDSETPRPKRKVNIKSRFPSSIPNKGCFPLMNEFIIGREKMLKEKMNRNYLIDNDLMSFDDLEWANQSVAKMKKYSKERSGLEQDREYAILTLGILKKRNPDWDDAKILRKFKALSSFCHS